MKISFKIEKGGLLLFFPLPWEEATVHEQGQNWDRAAQWSLKPASDRIKPSHGFSICKTKENAALLGGT